MADEPGLDVGVLTDRVHKFGHYLEVRTGSLPSSVMPTQRFALLLSQITTLVAPGACACAGITPSCCKAITDNAAAITVSTIILAYKSMSLSINSCTSAVPDRAPLIIDMSGGWQCAPGNTPRGWRLDDEFGALNGCGLVV
jgi:hypothetical protein